jgi:hypothetical protein
MSGEAFRLNNASTPLSGFRLLLPLVFRTLHQEISQLSCIWVYPFHCCISPESTRLVNDTMKSVSDSQLGRNSRDHGRILLLYSDGREYCTNTHRTEAQSALTQLYCEIWNLSIDCGPVSGRTVGEVSLQLPRRWAYWRVRTRIMHHQLYHQT